MPAHRRRARRLAPLFWPGIYSKGSVSRWSKGFIGLPSAHPLPVAGLGTDEKDRHGGRRYGRKEGTEAMSRIGAATAKALAAEDAKLIISTITSAVR